MSTTEVTDMVPCADSGRVLSNDNNDQIVPAAVKQGDVSLMTTFAGAAAEPFSKEAAAILRAPIEDDLVEIKPDGIVYLPWVHVANRLNDAFGVGGWTVVPRGPVRTEGNTIVYHGALFVLGRFVREAFGECNWQPTNTMMSRAAAAEGAYSDCVVRCAKNFGVGAELWDPGWRARWMAKYALKAYVPADGRFKAKWMFWRKDRERPWQTENLRAVPAVGAPSDEGEPEAPPAEPPKPDPLTELEELLALMAWPPKRAKAFFEKYFKALPEAFTPGQLKDAFSLLFAHRTSPEAYEAKVKELFAAGRVAAGEVSK